VFNGLLILLLVFPTYGTVFQMQSVDQQIKEADGIINAHFLKKRSIKLDDGSLATQMIFKLNQEYGIESDHLGTNELIVHYPGGAIGDEIVKVEGVPEFVEGENIIVMIKGNADRFWGMNLGFGTFKIINYGNEKIIVNTLFPRDPKVGQIKLEEFENSVKRIKGVALKVVNNPYFPTEKDSFQISRIPASLEHGKNRAIASTSKQEENRQGQSLNLWWLVCLLGLMGGMFRFYRHKITK
jgi:hypothetical protein